MMTESMMTECKNEALQQLINDAKVYPVKGRYYVYENFKLRLQYLSLSSMEYTDACRQLAHYLGV